MEQILDFLLRLGQNNNKPWFDAHKSEYKAVKAKFDEFSLEFLHGIEALDPMVHDLKLNDITYRIYRDMRFSNDKRPYKWHMGVYVCPKGKKSGMAGYYIHLEPITDTYFICAGLYNPDKDVVQSVRDEISFDPDSFIEALDKCRDFQLAWDSALKKTPKGYSSEDKGAEYYRLKTYEIYKPLTREEVLAEDFLERALKDLSRTVEFNTILNRCFEFAKEEAEG